MAVSNDLLESFGKRVRTLRIDAGYSQESLADKCGLDRTYIGGIERGERNVSLRNIALIASSLGLTISNLLKGVGSQ